MVPTPPALSGDSTSTPPNQLSIRQKYAWDWFSYHATQRMTALNYFFVTVGIFAVAYSKCVENGWAGFGFLVGALGATCSVAFWCLDVRNEELVNCGRHALGNVEEQLDMTIRKDDFNRTFLVESTDWLSGKGLKVLSAILPQTPKNVEGRSGRHQRWAGDIFAHHFWLRRIQFLALVAFAGGAVFALKGYPPLQTWRLWQCLHY